MTKHEQIIEHIKALEIGSKISVRQIAKELKVSEGTAYRAIKEAESQGYVSTIGRVGTIRIEKKEKENIERLTFAEVVNVVDGTVIGGKSGLYKALNKLVIGAMELNEMMKYVERESLLIVGNRMEAHELALQNGAAVLITGGFDTTDQVKELADEYELPVISSSYDTFTVASLINRAIFDSLIKKEIVVVEDILIPLKKTHYLHVSDLVEDWYRKSAETAHSRFPVVDSNGKVQGMVTTKDIIGVPSDKPIGKVMTKHPMTAVLKTSVASVAHMMVWEGIELLPVTDHQRNLVGVISRQDVLKAMQYMQKQPHMGETIEDIITQHFVDVEDEEYYIKTEVTPQMTNTLGTLSSGVLLTILTEAGRRLMRRHKKGEMVVENVTLYFLKPVQIDSEIHVLPRILELRRKVGKVDLEVYHDDQLVAKALMTGQVLDR